MNIQLLTEHHLEFLRLKVGCTGLSESIHVKIPHCWKSHVTAHIMINVIFILTDTDIKFDDYSATGPLSPVSSGKFLF